MSLHECATICWHPRWWFPQWLMVHSFLLLLVSCRCTEVVCCMGSGGPIFEELGWRYGLRFTSGRWLGVLRPCGGLVGLLRKILSWLLFICRTMPLSWFLWFFAASFLSFIWLKSWKISFSFPQYPFSREWSLSSTQMKSICGCWVTVRNPWWRSKRFPCRHRSWPWCWSIQWGNWIDLRERG